MIWKNKRECCRDEKSVQHSFFFHRALHIFIRISCRGTGNEEKQNIPQEENRDCICRLCADACRAYGPYGLSHGDKSDYYAKKAEQLHERERDIKAARAGSSTQREILADNKAVCTISVIHSQVKEPDKIIAMLQKELGLSEETARKRVEKVSSIEKVKTNVEKEVGDRIREYGLAGVKVDEDFKRYYPCNELASKVLGFTGGDNQGIIGWRCGMMIS